MEEVTNVITLEDGVEYAILEEVETESNKYLFLTNVDNQDDFCIRKIVLENNEEIIVGLDDDAEFDLALMLFAKNHKEELETIISSEN